MTAGEATPGALPTPGLGRRLACFFYEGVLLFGVIMIAGLLYATFTQQRHALVGTTGLQVLVFIVLGLYFVGFWSRTGQTLAMLTWHIRLVTREGRPVSRGRAFCRFLVAWLWFVPALAGLRLAGLTAALPTFVALVVGMLAYAGLVWLHPDRQYLHDAFCGTRLVSWHPPPRR